MLNSAALTFTCDSGAIFTESVFVSVNLTEVVRDNNEGLFRNVGEFNEFFVSEFDV